MSEEEEQPTKYSWGGARPGSGRPRGSIDARPRELRENMMAGAIKSKYGKSPNPDEPNNIVDFFANVANENLAAFCTMFGKLIPRQINTQIESTVDITYTTVEQVKLAMSDAGMTSKEIAAIEAVMLPKPREKQPVENGKLLDEELHDETFDRDRDHG